MSPTAFFRVVGEVAVTIGEEIRYAGRRKAGLFADAGGCGVDTIEADVFATVVVGAADAGTAAAVTPVEP